MHRAKFSLELVVVVVVVVVVVTVLVTVVVVTVVVTVEQRRVEPAAGRSASAFAVLRGVG